MKSITRIGSCLACASLLLAVPLLSGAYEVNVLRDVGSQWKNIENGQYETAIEILEERLKYNPAYRDVKLTNLCTAYLLVGKYNRATEVCDQAVEANGTFVTTAFNSRGVLNALKGDFLAAAADFDLAKKTHEDSMWSQLAHRDAIETNYQSANHNMLALRVAAKSQLTAGVTK
ncbi:MAG: tetratricopeptide repeat protein [Gammaproteobacteria bacterium]|nr:tetratricopeptide repeat protein [Gammaproteobacteria bacterium]